MGDGAVDWEGGADYAEADNQATHCYLPGLSVVLCAYIRKRKERAKAARSASPARYRARRSIEPTLLVLSAADQVRAEGARYDRNACA